jgi:hypothetical protein
VVNQRDGLTGKLENQQPRDAVLRYGPPELETVATLSNARPPDALDNGPEFWANTFTSARYDLREMPFGIVVSQRGGTCRSVLLPWQNVRHVVYKEIDLSGEVSP